MHLRILGLAAARCAAALLRVQPIPGRAAG